jgi:hypothetical protein
MKRVNILWLLLDSLFLIVFNFLFFMLGGYKNCNYAVWISYGFIHFAYILLLLTPFFARRGKVEYIYRRPPFFVTTTYFLIQLCVGVTFIIIAPETVKVTLIVQVILAGLFLAWLLAHLIANEHTADSTELHEPKLQFIKESSAKIQTVLQMITDKAIAKKVEQVYDLIRTSPAKSNADIHSMEQEIINEIEKLENIVRKNDTEQIISVADKISRLAEERSRQLKISNR